MANDMLGQILGGLAGGQRAPGEVGGLGDLLGRLTRGGGGGSGSGGGLGDMLGGALGGGRGMGGGRSALMAMLLPLAMQWVQRQGGIGAVLDRFRQQGQGQRVQSWISTGDNESPEPEAVSQVVGMEELSRMSQQLGVSENEVADGMAQLLPEVVNHVTPAGELPPDADVQFGGVLAALEGLLGQRR